MTSTRLVPVETLHRIVEIATRAPSVHNTQPWRWRGGSHTLELYADTSRQLPAHRSRRAQPHPQLRCGTAPRPGRGGGARVADPGARATRTRTAPTCWPASTCPPAPARHGRRDARGPGPAVHRPAALHRVAGAGGAAVPPRADRQPLGRACRRPDRRVRALHRRAARPAGAPAAVGGSCRPCGAGGLAGPGRRRRAAARRPARWGGPPRRPPAPVRGRVGGARGALTWKRPTGSSSSSTPTTTRRPGCGRARAWARCGWPPPRPASRWCRSAR